MKATSVAPRLESEYASFFKEPRKFPKRFPNGFPIGPRTERRAAENAKLRKLSIRHCEIRLSPNCQRRYGLSWAHFAKSRYLLTNKDWQTAARSCPACHQTIEAMSHAAMKRIVLDAIKRRRTA